MGPYRKFQVKGLIMGISRQVLSSGIIGALIASVCFGTSVAEAVDPGTIVAVGTSDSHGVLEGNDCLLSANCFVSTAPSLIQLRAFRDLVGVRDVSGFMDRFFTVSPSFDGADNTFDGLIRYALRVNGRILATGQKATTELRMIASVTDVTGGVEVELVRGLAGSISSRGGGTSISVSGVSVGVDVPIPLPKLDDVVNEPVRHIVTVPLRRGHTYRLRIIVEATAQQEFAPVSGQAQSADISLNGDEPFPNRAPGVPGGLMWDTATVALGDDQVELLDLLDQALAKHDADIKAALQGIDDQLEEIRILLLTPQGRRPGFPLKP